MTGSIVKRGKKFYIVYRRNGKQVWRVGGDTRREAEARLRVAIDGDGLRENMRLSDFAAGYLESAKLRLKATTFTTYSIMLDNHILPAFGSMRLEKIRLHDIERFVDEKITAGYAPASINKMIVVLKVLFKRAARYRLVIDNPSEFLKQLTIPNKPKDFLRPPEIGVLLEGIHRDLSAWYPFFMVAVFTGARVSELLALRWEDINWQTSEIRFAGSLYKGQITTTKTNTIGLVMVPPAVMAALKTAPKVINPLGLVFVSASGTPLERNNVSKRVFKKALRVSGLRDLTFHSLRHSYNAIMLSTGANLKIIQDQVRHKTIDMTLNTYGHALEEDKTRAVSAAANLVFSNTISNKAADICDISDRIKQ